MVDNVDSELILNLSWQRDERQADTQQQNELVHQLILLHFFVV